jgi:hypothetical protein
VVAAGEVHCAESGQRAVILAPSLAGYSHQDAATARAIPVASATAFIT